MCFLRTKTKTSEHHYQGSCLKASDYLSPIMISQTLSSFLLSCSTVFVQPNQTIVPEQLQESAVLTADSTWGFLDAIQPPDCMVVVVSTDWFTLASIVVNRARTKMKVLLLSNTKDTVQTVIYMNLRYDVLVTINHGDNTSGTY